MNHVVGSPCLILVVDSGRVHITQLQPPRMFSQVYQSEKDDEDGDVDFVFL